MIVELLEAFVRAAIARRQYRKALRFATENGMSEEKFARRFRVGGSC